MNCSEIFAIVNDDNGGGIVAVNGFPLVVNDRRILERLIENNIKHLKGHNLRMVRYQAQDWEKIG
jgi:hypothetical protein